MDHQSCYHLLSARRLKLLQPHAYLVNTARGEVVDEVSKAEVAILRLSAPYEARKGFMERFFHAGDLDFKEPEKTRILNILKQVPTIVDMYLERPAVIPEIAENSALHDREVRLSNGWVIKIGRGFDIYQKPEDWLHVGSNDLELRPCLETNVDVVAIS